MGTGGTSSPLSPEWLRLLDLKRKSEFPKSLILRGNKAKMLEKCSFLSLSKKRLPNVYQLKIKYSGERFHALTPDNITSRREISRRAI